MGKKPSSAVTKWQTQALISPIRLHIFMDEKQLSSFVIAIGRTKSIFFTVLLEKDVDSNFILNPHIISPKIQDFNKTKYNLIIQHTIANTKSIR